MGLIGGLFGSLTDGHEEWNRKAGARVQYETPMDIQELKSRILLIKECKDKTMLEWGEHSGSGICPVICGSVVSWTRFAFIQVSLA
ncbi:hypothetical protein NEOLEDRAFT_345995 [Neolentinus lepideus HHB14362 ss-1]|uniref:Uncharacterized protein n=1 Tax=Neolentinus lepideus HHB14362 ss-1 TaxID=1314782 RepID=A0A165SQ16_9AGAM|nr:hypothetical protein NEOLEDRAFT_345995 [Neolentinus lepideus HHB14362 ss-1]